MKQFLLIFCVITSISACMSTNENPNHVKSTKTCLDGLKVEINKSWKWRLSSLEKEKGFYLNELFYRSYKNDPLLYKDQQIIHKYFGVWVKKGHSSKAIYSIYPYYLKNNPSQYNDLKLLEVWGNLYSMCDSESPRYTNKEILDYVVGNSVRDKERLASTLDSVLPWYSFSEDSVAQDFHEISEEVIKKMSEDHSSVKNKKFRSELSYHVPGFYLLSQRNNFTLKRYSDAVELANETHGYASRVDRNTNGFKLLNKLSLKTYCHAIDKGEDHQDAALIAGIMRNIYRVENNFCHTGRMGFEFCTDTAITRLSQVDRGTRNFEFDQKTVTRKSDEFILFLNQFVGKNLNKQKLVASLLGDQQSRINQSKCK